MAITGIQSITYTVADLGAGTKFFTEFGLQADRIDPAGTDFSLPDGSSVLLRPLTPSTSPGTTVCWAVDTQQSLDKLAQELASDREVKVDSDGEVSCLDDAGVTVRLRLAQLRAVMSPPELINAPGRIERWNRNRRSFDRARPKVMQHVVFSHPEPRRAAAFYVNRLGFRISDIQEGGGYFLRADGAHEHHNLFWQLADSVKFCHVSFGVENIDELMAGAGHMHRHGYDSALGLGRHRISSTYFYYLPNPCGGDAEYSTDSDCLDDDWVPRVWGRAYGYIWWLAKPRNAEPEQSVRLSTTQERIL